MKMIKFLKELCNNNLISIQEYKTYKGQVIHGDSNGCLKSLKKNKFIKR